MRHSPKDLDALQQLILELYKPRDVKAFRKRLPRIAFQVRQRLILNLLHPHIVQAIHIAERIDQRRNGRIPTNADELSEVFCLTPRECEIARWVTDGKTNPEIAIILGTSPRTIEKHMESILRKLGVENRTAAAVILTRRNSHPNGASD
jgi:DNA-binding CsgD family transcriptional regulator